MPWLIRLSGRTGVPSSTTGTPGTTVAGENGVRYYYVAKNDGLQAIAQKMYGKASMWKIIQDANKETLGERGIPDPERVIDSVALLRLVNPSTPLRFAGGRRDMSDETAAKCIYVGMSAGIAGPLLTTPGADFDDDRELALRAGSTVGRKR